MKAEGKVDWCMAGKMVRTAGAPAASLSPAWAVPTLLAPPPCTITPINIDLKRVKIPM